MVAASEAIEPAPTTTAVLPVESPPSDRVGEVEADGHQRCAGLVDAGLGVGTLANPQRVLDEVVELAAERALVLRGAQRCTHLAEDLRLTDHHGVEAAGHREQVLDGAVLVVDVEVRDELVGRTPVARARPSVAASTAGWNLSAST